MYGFHSPLEAQLCLNPWGKEDALRLSSRLKQHRLERDLRALGVGTQVLFSLPLCPHLPKVDTPSTLLGCLYVLEGSTLGGLLLHRHFQQRFQIDANSGCAYYSGYGEETRAMWTQFVEYLKIAEKRSNVDSSSAVDAAVETFEALEAWLELQESKAPSID